MVLSPRNSQDKQMKTTISFMLYVPEPKRPPTIYPLSLPQFMSKDPVIVGCLIQDYFPSGSMDVTWSKSGDDTTTINFPPALASTGRYTMSSQLTLPANQCPAGASVTCSVIHDSDPAKDVDVPCVKPGEEVIWGGISPTLTWYLDTCAPSGNLGCLQSSLSGQSMEGAWIGQEELRSKMSREWDREGERRNMLIY